MSVPALAFFLLIVGVAIFIASDSRQRNMSWFSRFALLVGIVVLPIFGLFILPFILIPAYFFFRPNKRNSGKNASSENASGNTALGPSKLCPKCGTDVDVHASLCPSCGNHLSFS